MTHTSAFKTPEGEAAYFAAYDAAMALWPVPYEEVEIPTRFGTTHVAVSGPEDARPLVLLHGYLGTLTMWLPNVAEFSKDYRVYAIDVMGQPGWSIPDPDVPIRDTADFITWLSETIDRLKLDRFHLAGVSYGGWLGLLFAMAKPEHVHKLVLLSPAASFQPFSKQFSLRGMLMIWVPTRFTVKSYMAWLGVEITEGDKVARNLLDLMYLGLKHFRIAPETMRIMATEFTDDELRQLRVPVLLLIGEDEVMYDPAAAFARAHRLIPNLSGELVPDSSHGMCGSHYQIVNAKVLDFLKESPSNTNERVAAKSHVVLSAETAVEPAR